MEALSKYCSIYMLNVFYFKCGFRNTEKLSLNLEMQKDLVKIKTVQENQHG